MTAARFPLPTLKTMLAICSDARDTLKKELKRGAETRDMRWHHDRTRMLFAIDSRGERMNDGGEEWRRTKSDVADLLARYPDAVKIVVDSGIDVAANHEDMECGNYVPHYWQVSIWRADRAVFSEAEIDDLIRARTGFQSMRDMLSAKGDYRPSLDCSDPIYLAIADRYDELQEYRGDDRRAYRYNRAA